MRVPNITTYTNSTFRLGNLTSSLKDANEIVTTQKQINEISDDPLGQSQVLSMKSFLGNLEQIEQNVIMGKTWLESGENALDGVNSLILEAKTQVTRLASDSTTADERDDAVARINSIIEQIVTLGNTQVNGSYIFGGTDTDIVPMEISMVEGNERVVYKGNDIPFEVRTDKNSGVQVGRDGYETFWDTDIEINSTNNIIVFKEDNGHGSASEKTLEAVVPDGIYTKDELVIAVRNALNHVSQDEGYGVRYVVDYNDDTQRFSIREDGSYNGYIRTQFMWDTGEEARVTQVQTSSSVQPESVSISVVHSETLTIGTIEDPEDPKPFRLIWNKLGRTWEVENNPGYVMPSSIEGTSSAVDIDFDENGTIDMHVRFDTPVQDGAYVQFEIEPAEGDHSTGHEIGFNETDLIKEPPVSDNNAAFITDLVITGGVNDTIIFEEVDSSGVATTMTADINVTTSGATYTDMTVLALAIETEMELESAAFGNTIDYAVTYDPENSRFNIREDGSNLNELNLQWSASTASAATTLGFYPLDDAITYPHSAITINSQNNILDFQEESPPGTFTTLQAWVSPGDYSDMADLAAAIEDAMENKSASSGNAVTYSVAYNQGTDQFEIQRSAGGALTSINLLWNTGSGSDFSIGETLGYNPEIDDIGAGLGGVPYSSDAQSMLMSLFSTSINDTNNMLDFEEINTSGVATTLSAQIASGTYESVSDLEKAVADAMSFASAREGNNVNYDVSYDEAANRFQIQRSGGTTLTNLNLLWASGPNMGNTIVYNLGYDTALNDTGGGILGPYTGDTDPVWMSFDTTNNRIDFQEVNINGTVSDEMSIEIPEGNYTSPSQVASEIELALSNASPNGVDYNVLYNSEQGFLIKGSSAQVKGFDLLWNTGDNFENSAADKLGFNRDIDIHTSYAESDQDVVNITIDATNNKLDFKEFTSDDIGKSVSQLTALIDQRVYTSHSELASEIEEALELESRMNGNTIDYSVSFDTYTKKFTIKENGTELEEFQLLWNSGDNAPLDKGGSGEGIGTVLGFDSVEDDIEASLKSVRDAEWGIFNTLVDLKQYLLDNDRDGIERSIGRLELNYDNMTSKIVDIGMKYSRLEVRQAISTQVSLSVTERRSNIEDADIIKSIMDLKNIETAYQAALSSTSSILNLSLVDYLR